MADLGKVRMVQKTLSSHGLAHLPHLLPGCEERLAAHDEKSLDRIAKSLSTIALERKSPEILVQAVQTILIYEGVVACEVANTLSHLSCRLYPPEAVIQSIKVFGHDTIVTCLGRHSEPTACEIVKGAGHIALDTRLEANSIKALALSIQTAAAHRERAAHEIIHMLCRIALFRRSADIVISACKEIQGKPPADALKILAGFLK